MKKMGSRLMAVNDVAPAGLEKNKERCRSRGGSFDYPAKGEHVMQYLLMIYYDEEWWAQLPEA